LKKNVASQIVSAQLTAVADGSEVTTGTTNVAVEIDGVAGTGGTATHIANGKGEDAPSQPDTKGDKLDCQFKNTAAVTVLGQDYTTFPQTADNNTLLATIDGKVDTAQTDLDTLTGTDGVTLATSQPNYAPNTTTPPTAAAIADQVWDEAIAGHAGVGSTGEQLSAAGSAGDPWATALPGAYGAGTAGKIVGDNIDAPISTVDAVVDGIASTIGTAGAGLTEAGGTGDHLTAINLPNQTMDITGNLSGSVGSVTGAVGSVTGAVGSVTGTVGGVAGTITTLDALDTAQDTQHAATLTRLGTPAGASVSADIATVDGVADGIKAVTDALPDSGALTSLATATNLATLDTVADAIRVVTDLIASSYVSSSAVTGTLTTTTMTTALTEATDDHYNGRNVVFLTGVLAGQATDTKIGRAHV